jgi:CubicO group peptidase (beta-lactamase class C family)
MGDVTCLSTAPQALALLQQGFDSRLHLGAQIYVSRQGRTLIDDAIGEAQPGRRLTTGHRLLWRSAGKPITAAAILKCRESRGISLDQRIAEFIPAYAAGGKSHITLRHLLTHTVALAPAPTAEFATLAAESPTGWDDVIRSICDTPLRTGWNVETGAAYEPVRSWFILGEVLQIVEGRSFAEIIHDDWFVPLGMTHCSVGGSSTEIRSTAGHVAPLFVRTSQGLEPLPVDGSPFPSPGASLRGPIRELARFYEMLLARGTAGNDRLLDAATVADMTARHRAGRFDETFRHIVDFGLGVIIDSNQYGRDSVPYGFGRHCSPRTFGHGGAQTSIAFADPEYDLVVAVAFNTAPGEPAHQRRMREFLTLLYSDLGLTKTG